MVACVAVAVQQSTGTPYLVLDTSKTDTSTCIYVIEDGSSNAWRELGQMSIENANVIGVAVGLVWAVAWGLKQIVRTIRTTDSVAPDT